MKKIFLIIFIICFLCFPLFAYQLESWDTQDTILQLTFFGTLFIDVWQTYSALYHDENYSEANPILGNNPTWNKVLVYNIGGLFIHTGISMILPKPYRTIWQSIWIGIEINSIHNNYQCGARIYY